MVGEIIEKLGSVFEDINNNDHYEISTIPTALEEIITEAHWKNDFVDSNWDKILIDAVFLLKGHDVCTKFGSPLF